MRTLSKALAVTVVAIVVLGSGAQKVAPPSLFATPTAAAQVVRQQDVGQQVYQQLPDLPLENQYISKETGQVDAKNTLVTRLLRYHVYAKGRPPNYRLDWKLTLADYLDANEIMEESMYPGFDTLRSNPIEGDRKAIQNLNRAQRNALVQAFVNIFNPTSRSSTNLTNPAPNPATPRLTVPPRPGDAQLLKP